MRTSVRAGGSGRAVGRDGQRQEGLGSAGYHARVRRWVCLFVRGIPAGTEVGLATASTAKLNATTLTKDGALGRPHLQHEGTCRNNTAPQRAEPLGVGWELFSHGACHPAACMGRYMNVIIYENQCVDLSLSVYLSLYIDIDI